MFQIWTRPLFPIMTQICYFVTKKSGWDISRDYAENTVRMLYLKC